MPSYPRGEWPEYEVWDRVADEWWWADRFGWTPDQVNELDPETYWRMKHVDTQAAIVRKEAQERANR